MESNNPTVENKVSDCRFCSCHFEYDWLYEDFEDEGDINFHRVYMLYCPICGKKLEKYNKNKGVS